jgi:hypothetical protein
LSEGFPHLLSALVRDARLLADSSTLTNHYIITRVGS